MIIFWYNTIRTSKYCSAYGGIPKRLKGRAWKARRHVTVCEGSNPSSSAKTKKISQAIGIFSLFVFLIPETIDTSFKFFLKLFESKIT